MLFWGETEVLWTDAVAALVHWIRHRRAVAAASTILIAEVEEYLAEPR
ncbi:MAG TPA: hypothetical protein VKV06_04750 [Acidimicrobiales bacterium]|nr:hypothetical protein [Acidimicrobiales bacterium]